MTSKTYSSLTSNCQFVKMMESPSWKLFITACGCAKKKTDIKSIEFVNVLVLQYIVVRIYNIIIYNMNNHRCDLPTQVMTN